MKERPTSVMVLAIINLVFAGFGCLGLLFGLVFRLGLIKLPDTGQPNPALDLMENNAGFRVYNDVSLVLLFLATVLIVAASIGMFQLRPWARAATIGWGVFSIFMKVIGSVIQYFLITAPMLEQTSGRPEHVAMMVGMVVGFVFLVALIGYYLVMIVMLTRPSVVDAFTPEVFEDDGGLMPAAVEPGDVNS